ncbi:MAG: aminoacyl-tRNA hydrolase [Treponematales bacterium]
MIELVVFLGNPGAQYAGNRHNAGWLLARRLPFFDSLRWRQKFRGLYADMSRGALAPGGGAGGGKVHFLMPETFINLSGEAAAEASSFFKVPAGNILIVHDELELPLGVLSLKFSGGLGGHNGLRSLKASLGTADFWRLRLGIGRPDDRVPGKGGRAAPGGVRVLDWVLSDFSSAEQPVLSQTLDAGAGLLTRALTDGPEPLLPEWAKKQAGE